MAGTAGGPVYIHELKRAPGLPESEREKLEAVESLRILPDPWKSSA